MSWMRAQTKFWVEGVGLSSLAIFGIVGNVFSCIVLSRSVTEPCRYEWYSLHTEWGRGTDKFIKFVDKPYTECGIRAVSRFCQSSLIVLTLAPYTRYIKLLLQHRYIVPLLPSNLRPYLHSGGTWNWISDYRGEYRSRAVCCSCYNSVAF